MVYSHEISHKWLKSSDIKDTKNLMNFNTSWSTLKLPYVNNRIEHVKTGDGTPLGKFDFQWINIFNSIDVP